MYEIGLRLELENLIKIKKKKKTSYHPHLSPIHTFINALQNYFQGVYMLSYICL